MHVANWLRSLPASGDLSTGYRPPSRLEVSKASLVLNLPSSHPPQAALPRPPLSQSSVEKVDATEDEPPSFRSSEAQVLFPLLTSPVPTQPNHNHPSTNNLASRVSLRRYELQALWDEFFFKSMCIQAVRWCFGGPSSLYWRNMSKQWLVWSSPVFWKSWFEKIKYFVWHLVEDTTYCKEPPSYIKGQMSSHLSCGGGDSFWEVGQDGELTVLEACTKNEIKVGYFILSCSIFTGEALLNSMDYSTPIHVVSNACVTWRGVMCSSGDCGIWRRKERHVLTAINFPLSSIGQSSPRMPCNDAHLVNGRALSPPEWTCSPHIPMPVERVKPNLTRLD